MSILSKKIAISLVVLLYGLIHDTHAQQLESKIDKFYADLITGLKEVKLEKKDELATAKLKALKTKLDQRAEQLQVELDNFINTLSDEETLEWDDKLRAKPFNKEIFELTFEHSFIERINKNSEFESAYNAIIDLSDRITEVDFAEPVNPLSECSITLNGGIFKNQTFVLPAVAMKAAEAFTEENDLTFNIEGYSGEVLIGISFLTASDKPGNYKWIGDYNLSVTYFDGSTELLFGGHEGKGTIILEQVEQIGGWVKGQFNGKIESEDSKQVVEIKGTFKVIRNINPN